MNEEQLDIVEMVFKQIITTKYVFKAQIVGVLKEKCHLNNVPYLDTMYDHMVGLFEAIGWEVRNAGN